jgi:hypothetical protein
MTSEKEKYGLDLGAEIVKSGLLWKRSRRSRNLFAMLGFRNWKERMFVLKGNQELLYYKAGHMDEIKGSLSIKNARVISVTPQEAVGKRNAFEIVAENGENILLYTEDSDEVETWMYAIEHVGKK